MSNREKTEQFILTYIEKLLPGSGNKELYIEYFSTLDDEQFSKFMQDLDTGAKHLVINAPNFNKTGLSTERNLAIAKELGHNFFQRIWIESDDKKSSYLTPIPYMVVDLPLRRQAQLLVKKISIPEDNKTVDDLTGQPTGKSKGAGISYPETQVMAAMGLDKSLLELLKYRGGDIKGFNAMNTMISRTGGVRLQAISHLASGVESTKTLSAFLTAMHLKNTLLD
jgi:hypothetical protein